MFTNHVNKSVRFIDFNVLKIDGSSTGEACWNAFKINSLLIGNSLPELFTLHHNSQP